MITRFLTQPWLGLLQALGPTLGWMTVRFWPKPDLDDYKLWADPGLDDHKLWPRPWLIWLFAFDPTLAWMTTSFGPTLGWITVRFWPNSGLDNYKLWADPGLDDLKLWTRPWLEWLSAWPWAFSELVSLLFCYAFIVVFSINCSYLYLQFPYGLVPSLFPYIPVLWQLKIWDTYQVKRKVLSNWKRQTSMKIWGVFWSFFGLF